MALLTSDVAPQVCFGKIDATTPSGTSLSYISLGVLYVLGC